MKIPKTHLRNEYIYEYAKCGAPLSESAKMTQFRVSKKNVTCKNCKRGK